MTGERDDVTPAGDGGQKRVVQGGEIVVSDSVHDVLVSAPVGSCVAVCLWDPSGVGGLLHFLWPDSKLDPARAESEPASYADTGLVLLFEQAERVGAEKRRCKVRLVGAADFPDRDESDRWAKRNLLAARSVLWRNGVLLDGEEVGGTQARRATLTVADGVLSVTVDESLTGV
jgi:chemotaxis protein CheD